MAISFKPGLICTDLDRTLLNNCGEIGAENQRALRLAARVGIPIVMASGRRLNSLITLFEQLGVSGYKVFFNGACIADEHDQLIRSVPITPLSVQKILTIGIEEHVNVAISSLAGGYDHLDPAAGWVPNYLQKQGSTFTVQQLMAISKQEAVFKVSFNDNNRDKLARVLQRVRKTLAVESCWTDTKYIEMTALNINKLTSVSWLSQYLNVPMATTLAFGDYENDLALLQHAGWGVAMSNALPDVKRNANQVINNDNYDGLSKVLTNLLK